MNLSGIQNREIRSVRCIDGVVYSHEKWELKINNNAAQIVATLVNDAPAKGLRVIIPYLGIARIALHPPDQIPEANNGVL